MEEKKKYALFIWAAYLIVFIACGVADLATPPGLSWAHWVWVGFGVGFAITTVNMILTKRTCPKCGKMLNVDDVYCGRCRHKFKKIVERK